MNSCELNPKPPKLQTLFVRKQQQRRPFCNKQREKLILLFVHCGGQSFKKKKKEKKGYNDFMTFFHDFNGEISEAT